jgi:high affinity choline transporter 7
MASWNVVRQLIRPDLSTKRLKRLIRLAIVALGALATIMALKVQSVQALWFFTSDLVFVLLFPQLVFALFDSKANRAGSISAFIVSLILRLGGGEPLFGWRSFIPYPEIFTADPASWYNGETMLFPFKTLAAAAGMILLPVVSRLTARWDAPREIAKHAK